MSRNLMSSVVFAAALFGCNNGTKDTTGDTATGGTDTGTGNSVDTADQPDADGDSILDVTECPGVDNPKATPSDCPDTDGDGLPDFEDKDSDGDTISDAAEAGDEELFTLPVDSDGDGVPDYLDLDSDNNCIPDSVESGHSSIKEAVIDTDGDGIKDYADPDNDNDGILDTEEIGDAGVCTPPDTDGDGSPDYMDVDSDNDGIGDKWEAGTTTYDTTPKDTDGDGVPDFRDSDSDDDGIADKDESGVSGTDIEPNDTDGDGLYDFQDTDADGDGLSDADETTNYKTDPYDSDSDGDGFSDGAEVLAATDPLDSASVIDGVYVDVSERTDVEEDFTFNLQIDEGDIGLLSDTTGSMSGTISAVQKAFTKTINDLEAVIPNMEGGAAASRDYNYGSYGSVGDKPFMFTIGVTDDMTKLQSAVNSWSPGGGSDGPEGSMEGLYQAASGEGYDQNCNGSYDSTTDMLPFLESASDPFGGGGGENYDPTTSGIGIKGGFGFRDYSLPVIIYATDNYMRDATSTNATYNGVPGGCPLDAGEGDVASSFLDLGAYFIGVATSALPVPQMDTLAADTNSYADMNGDGTADDLLVYQFNPSSATYATDFADYIVNAVTQLVATIKFTSVSLQVEGDIYGFVTNIDPEGYTDIDPDTTSSLTFTLSFRGVVAATKEDQLFLLTLNIIGDGTTLLDTKDIVIRVPGTKF